MNSTPLDDQPIQPIFLMTDQQKAQAFLDEFKVLRDKYGFDFVAGIQLIKINVDSNIPIADNKPTGDSVPDKAPKAVK